MGILGYGYKALKIAKRNKASEALADIFKKSKIASKKTPDKSKLDLLTREKIDSLEKETKDNKKMQLTLALSYGSRQEIVSSINKLLKNKKNKISMEDFSNSLYTSKIPDPELLIRTGYEKRLSNFLLWQIAYSEIFFIDEYWPNFNKEMLKKIIDQYKSGLLTEEEFIAAKKKILE